MWTSENSSYHFNYKEKKSNVGLKTFHVPNTKSSCHEEFDIISLRVLISDLSWKMYFLWNLYDKEVTLQLSRGRVLKPWRDKTILDAKDNLQRPDIWFLFFFQNKSKKEETTSKNNKRQKVIFKQKEEQKEPEVCDLLELVNHKRKDQCAIFGELIASKLRSLSPPVRPVAQHKLLSILLEFEIDNSNGNTSIHYIEHRLESPNTRANDDDSMESEILTELGWNCNT